MGCDIHFFTERYSTDNNYDGPRDISEERNIKLGTLLNDDKVEPRWVSADKWSYEDDGEDSYWDLSYNDRFYRGRNYSLFEILAGVRGDDDNAIEPPRGIPDDASLGYKTVSDRWDGDAHSHSYFTLDELLDVDWSQYDDRNLYLDEFLATIEKMKGIDNDTRNVRCLFFFDN